MILLYCKIKNKYKYNLQNNKNYSINNYISIILNFLAFKC